jgi:hypothetical protein
MGVMLLGDANQEAPAQQSFALPAPGLLRQPAPYLNAYGSTPRILGENIGIASQALVSEFFEENESSRILQLL